MTAALPAVDRRVPPLGGFSLTFLRLEVRRLLRNRRTMVFTLIMPPAFYLLFGGLSDAYRTAVVGRGNVSAYLVISFAVYGSMLANTSAGASVALERALGWSRQLRLTPLNPFAYMITKVLTAMVVGAGTVLGIALFAFSRQLMSSLLPADFPSFATPQADLRVIVYAIAAALLTVIAVTLVPIWQLSRRDPQSALTTSGSRSEYSLPD